MKFQLLPHAQPGVGFRIGGLTPENRKYLGHLVKIV